MKRIVFSLFILICSITLFQHASFAQVSANTPVPVPDVSLRVKITEALGKPSNAKLTAGEWICRGRSLGFLTMLSLSENCNLSNNQVDLV